LASAYTFAADMAEAIITVEKTNRDRCFICQQDTKEKLIHPSLFNREHDCTGYDTIARNFPLFQDQCSAYLTSILPSPTLLDEGDGIENVILSPVCPGSADNHSCLIYL